MGGLPRGINQHMVNTACPPPLRKPGISRRPMASMRGFGAIAELAHHLDLQQAGKRECSHRLSLDMMLDDRPELV